MHRHRPSSAPSREQPRSRPRHQCGRRLLCGQNKPGDRPEPASRPASGSRAAAIAHFRKHAGPAASTTGPLEVPASAPGPRLTEAAASTWCPLRRHTRSRRSNPEAEADDRITRSESQGRGGPTSCCTRLPRSPWNAAPALPSASATGRSTSRGSRRASGSDQARDTAGAAVGDHRACCALGEPPLAGVSPARAS